MTHVKHILGILFILTATTATAQNWFKTNGPVEDDVLDLCIDSNGILYAVTPLGVNRSSDGGEHWTRPFTFGGQSSAGHIIVAANGSSILSSNRAIFVSTDGGSTFEGILTFSSNLAINFTRDAVGRIFAVSDSGYGLYCTDHGYNWRGIYVLTENSSTPIAMAASKGTIIGQTKHWMLYSLDSGQTWKEMVVLSSRLRRLLIGLNDLWISVADDIGTRYLVDSTWVPFGELYHNRKVYSADAMTNGDLLVSSPLGIFIVKDLSTWVDVSSGFERDTDQYLPVTRFIEDRKNNLYYAATSGAGVWKSAIKLGKDAESESRPITVIPNPFSHRTTISFSDDQPSWSEVELRNILGVVVWKKAREYSSGGDISIEVPGIPAGNYLLVLRTSGRTESQWVTIID